MAGQPISAAREAVATDGLAGAVGAGLFFPDSDPLDPNGRWAGPAGYSLEGDPCGAPGYTSANGFCDVHPFPEADEWTPFVEALADQVPVRLGAAVKCSTFGSPTDSAVWEDKARRQLDLTRYSQLATTLWTGGAVPANHHLASGDATVLNEGGLADPTAVPLVTAIAMLEDAFGDCSWGSQQLIHAERKVTPYLSTLSLVQTSPGSPRLWTFNGSLVIADRGYPGTGPNDAAAPAGQTWLYSTGVLSGRLGEVRIPETDLGEQIDARTNNRWVRAEQVAAINWLCCHLAILVDLTGSTPEGVVI